MKNLIILLSLVVLASPVRADHYAAPKNAAFEEECSSCHLAFPPYMLDANSWRAVMDGLKKHFGADASLDEKRRLAITNYLTANAGGRHAGTTADSKGRPLLRVTETAHFLHEHGEISAGVWKRSSIGGPANCVACHPRAANGNFEEHGVRIPR